MAQIILFNKPFGVLSQFTDTGTADSTRKTLSDFIDVKGVYAAGRLDRDSEGLLLLTDDGRLQNKITSPKHKMPKTYYVQVEGAPNDTDLAPLRDGIELKDGIAGKASAKLIDAPANLWPRDPPVRFRKTIPDSWIEITISEGRNRQVRRMTAAIGFPTLRLIRHRIGSWSIDGIETGTWVKI